MKLIKQSCEILKQGEGLIGIKKLNELAARVCYKSEDKITDTSYIDIEKRMIKSGHLSVLEHGTVYLRIDQYDLSESIEENELQIYFDSPFCVINQYDNVNYITTNLRFMIEHNRLQDLMYLCEPTQCHDKRVSVRFITSIGISRELNRHRYHSISEESTRYCNYSKDKFGNELTFIIPTYENINEPSIEYQQECSVLSKIEDNYMALLKYEYNPQQARDILPLATKTELIHTAFVDQWNEFFKLRTAEGAHPCMRWLANDLKSKFINKELIYEKGKV